MHLKLPLSRVTLAIFALLSAGCISGAERSCQKEQGFNGAAFGACERAFEKVAPYYDDADKALVICKKEMDACAEFLHAENPVVDPGSDCRAELTEVYAAGSEQWFDQANRVVSEYNGCRAGIIGYFDAIESQVHPTPRPVGCYMEVGAQGRFRCVDYPGARPRSV